MQESETLLGQGEPPGEDVTKNEEETEEVPRKAKEERPEKVSAQSTDEQATSGPDEERIDRGSAGLVRKGRETSDGQDQRKRERGKGEHGSKGGLGSKGTQEAQQNTRMMKGADEDELEEKEHEEECDCWDCTHCWEYIDGWEKRMLPKRPHIRFCDAGVLSAENEEAGKLLKMHRQPLLLNFRRAENASAALRKRKSRNRSSGPCGASHGGRWLTPPGHDGLGRGRKEKEEMGGL